MLLSRKSQLSGRQSSPPGQEGLGVVVFHDIASAASVETLQEIKSPLRRGNDTSFCESGLRTFLLFAQQNCISKGKGAAANAETKPPGLREKALSEVRSYDLRVNVDLKKGKQKSSPDLNEELGGENAIP